MKIPPELEEHRMFKAVFILYGIAIVVAVTFGIIAWVLHLK
jgi:hypothetical protein